MPTTKKGRPYQGYVHPVMTRVDAEVDAWLDALVRETGIRHGELVRRILEDARRREWHPRGLPSIDAVDTRR